MEDADAFAELYRREGESVPIFLTRRAWDGEMALELTAEMFAAALRSWRRLAKLAPEQQRAWLFTAARRQLARYLRRAKIERSAVRRLGMQLPEVDQDDLRLTERRAGLPELREGTGPLGVGERWRLAVAAVTNGVGRSLWMR
jgi:DNA-directed RNA polymerase specialized sigma24 family protein